MAQSVRVFKVTVIGVAGMLVAGLLVATLRDDPPRTDAGPDDGETQTMIDQAEHRLIRGCMRRRGLEYPEAPEGELAENGGALQHTRVAASVGRRSRVHAFVVALLMAIAAASSRPVVLHSATAAAEPTRA